MKYSFSSEWTEKTHDLIERLGFKHIPLERVCCIKSSGTKTRRTIARIHGLDKVMQLGMQTNAFYVIELIAEKFDGQNEEEKIKTIIHELLHVPNSFGGGFRHHNPFVNEKIVEKHYAMLTKK